MVRPRMQNTRIDLFDQVTSATGDLIWDRDFVADKLWCNQRAVDVFAKTREEFLANPNWWSELVHPDDRERHQRTFAEFMAGTEDTWLAEWRFRVADGSYRTFLGRVHPTRGAESKPTRMVTVLTDITEQRRAEREREAELLAAKDAAEAGNRAKSEFLATMSHEIRTPMNGILAMAELLLAADLKPQQRDCAEIILKSGRGLLSVVNDVLEFSRAEAGGIQLCSEPFDPGAAVMEAVNLMAARAHEKCIGLFCEIDPSVPAKAVGDGGRLRQVVMNLVGNAVKFTSSGDVTVRVSVQGSTSLRVEVRDTGIGIDPRFHTALFDPFMQADGSISRRYGGTGLGLAISKRLVNLMGGDIGFTSVPGEGSTFWFDVALLPAAAEPAAPPPPVATRAINVTRHILVVEDNAVNQKVARKLLERLGHTVDVAGNGREALDVLRERRYDLVLMDCQMPEMDGFAATAEIRRLEEAVRGDRLPIVAVTAHALNGDREKCLSAGMDDYISKPIDLAGLRGVIERTLPLPTQL